MSNKKGNIVLALLISLLLVTTTLQIYIGFARDKRSSSISMSRVRERIEMNAYVVAAQASVFDYFSTIEIPIAYTQYFSTNGEDTIIHRVALTDPVIIDPHNIQSTEILGSKDEYTLLREDKNANFAGYKYDIKIAFDVPLERAVQEFRVANLMLNQDVEFWEDNNLYLKSNDAYTARLKDIPIVIVVNYGTWEQHIKANISGLIFRREVFDIIRDSPSGSAVGSTDMSDRTTNGVARGVVITDGATMQVVESYRIRK